jgi:hypothetical protein
MGALQRNGLSSEFEDYAASSWMLSVATRNGSREAMPSPRISYGHRQVRKRLM